MMSSTAHLSPLEQIQQAEMARAQQVRTAQQEVDAQIAQARQRVSALKAEAKTLGNQQGQRDYQDALRAAHDEAARIVDEAHKRVEQLGQNSDGYIEEMVAQIVAIIRGEDTP